MAASARPKLKGSRIGPFGGSGGSSGGMLCSRIGSSGGSGGYIS